MSRPKKPESLVPADPVADAVAESHVRRSDRRLERRAAVNGWATPEPKKRAIVKRLIAVCNPKTPEGKTAKLRSVLIAARTLISADLRQQQLELEARIAAGLEQEGSLAALVGRAEAIANELELDRRRDREATERAAAEGPVGDGSHGGPPGAVP